MITFCIALTNSGKNKLLSSQGKPTHLSYQMSSQDDHKRSTRGHSERIRIGAWIIELLITSFVLTHEGLQDQHNKCDGKTREQNDSTDINKLQTPKIIKEDEMQDNIEKIYEGSCGTPTSDQVKQKM